MRITTAVSTNPSPTAAAAEIRRALGSAPRALLYFGSSSHDAPALAQALQSELPDTVTVGCSTAGEIITGSMLKDSVVAMAFDGNCSADTSAARGGDDSNPRFDLAVEVVHDLRERSGLDGALAGLERQLGEPLASLDLRRHVGIVLADGLSSAEEWLIGQLGDRTDLIFVGGSAGDDLKFAKTFVSARGQSYSNAAVLVVLRLDVPFETVKTQSFKVLDRRLHVTKADPATRTVFELDGKPAAVAYAEALGTSVAELPKLFMRHPLGLMAGGQPFVRSPARIVDDSSIVFFCSVLEGMELAVLESTDIVAETRSALASSIARLGGVDGVVNFHCILRTLDLEATGQTDAYGQVFANIPTIGFSTYGEAYLGHINQTSTLLLLAKHAA